MKKLSTPFLSLLTVAFLAHALYAESADKQEEQGDAVALPDDAQQLIEAEHDKPSSTSDVVEVEGASGGKVVQSELEWEPVFQTDALAEVAGPVTLWIRYRGGPVQLKTVVDGQQIARDWSWDKPEVLKWRKLGVYETSELGTKVLFIRGKADGPVAIDCIAYKTVKTEEEEVGDVPQNPGEAGIDKEATRGDAGTLPSASPDSGLPLQIVPLSVDWSTVEHDLPQELWGVSLFRIVHPVDSGDQNYVDWLATLNPVLVRVHSGEMTRRWWNADAEQWDKEAMRASFEPHRQFLEKPNLKLMICAPYDWPASVRNEAQDGKYLAPDRYDAGRQNFRDLLTILIDDLSLPVTHLELTNEWDNTYDKLDKLDELWPLVRMLADEARDIAPGLQVGGPAFTYPKPTWIHDLLDVAGEQIDFISWHSYASGQRTTSNEAVMARVAEIADEATLVLQELNDRGLTGVESYVTEFNVQWTWQPYERRHANSIGAAFQASLVLELAESGVDGGAVWHAMGNAYGLVDDSGSRRATGQLYLWANRYAYGQVAVFRLTGEVDHAEPFELERRLAVAPVTMPDGERTLFLVNQTAGPMRLSRTAEDIMDGNSNLRRLSITAEGAEVADMAPDEAVELPGYSVLLLTTAAMSEPLGRVDLNAQHTMYDF